MLICPNEVSISNIIRKKTLSASNYATIDISNTNQAYLSEFLNNNKPFERGVEPGSYSYVRASKVAFLRNSCIDPFNYSNQVAKEIYLNPKYDSPKLNDSEAVLLCKDANVGDTCLFIRDTDKEYVLSSGIVNLKFNSEQEKFYCLAFMRDDYFRSQLDSLTPKGVTIRHAGEKFLECKLPEIRAKEDSLIPLISSLLRNIAYAERNSGIKIKDSCLRIQEELGSVRIETDVTSVCELINSLRVDAGYYSKTVRETEQSIRNYKHGFSTLDAFGFDIKRGPNLQKRDLGRSLKSASYRKNYHLLVYPSDISDNGFILRETYIGARNPVWYLRDGDILFSAEGTVGKVFIICDEKMSFITNIHGIILSPKEIEKDNWRSIILGQYLQYLRWRGYFDKVSVGGQGGSFAVNYWENLAIPNFSKEFSDELRPLYHSVAKITPSKYEPDQLANAGIFQLNQFRIICRQILKKLVNDIKIGTPEEPEFYEKYIDG